MGRVDELPQGDHPQVTALITCDRIVANADTGNFTLVEIFNTVTFQAVPAVLGRLAIYVSLRRGKAEAGRFSLGIYAPDGSAVAGSRLEVREWGPEGTSDFRLEYQMVPVPAPGAYELRVFDADRVLAKRLVRVDVSRPPVAGDAP